MSLLRRGARRVARSRSVARLVLGIEVPPIAADRRYFDLTTPALIRVVARRIGPQSSVLDMGTGAFAAIGLALWKRTACRVICSDVDPALVEQARANIAANGAPIEVVQASFFDGIDGAFDCVTFNAPYVPSALVGADGGDPRYAGQADGGATGIDVIDGFLAGFESAERIERAYLGVNRMMVPTADVEASVEARPRLRVDEVSGVRPLPIDVFSITRK